MHKNMNNKKAEEDKNTTIQLCVEKEMDLYNPLDPAHMRINDRVYSYLKSFTTESEINRNEFDKLQVISNSPVNGERFKQALHAAVKKDQREFDWQISINNKRAVWEYIAGIGLSLAGVLLAYYMDKILIALVSFFGSMILRDAVMIGTKINPDIKRLKKRLKPLMACEVEVIPGNQGTVL